MSRFQLLIVGVFGLCTPVLAGAQGLVAEFLGVDGAEARLLALDSLEVVAQLTDSQAATTEVRRYSVPTSSSGGAAEATLTFYRPLTTPNAVVVGLIVQGAEWSAEVLEPAEADALRIELTKKLRDPAPLRDLGTPMLVAHALSVPVGLFQPPIEIELTLERPLEARGTLWGLSVPVDWHRQPAGLVKVEATALTTAPVRTLYSPYHTLALVRANSNQLAGHYQGYQRCTAFDVSVLMATGYEAVRVDLVPHRYAGPNGEYGNAHGTFMALISTPDSPPDDAVSPRDIALVIDRSGSMDGDKISQARAALTSVLGGLRTQDTFSLVVFDGVVESFLAEAVPATADNVAAAQSFVDDLLADGGTNIFDALKTAFSTLPTQTGHPRYVVFLTDGQATAGETETDAILAMARGFNEVGARIFAFGIGYDVNTLLLDQLALESGGAAIYITPGQPVDVAVEGFFESIADPVLTNPVLDASGIGGSLLYPASLPDLFAGQTVAVLGRFATHGAGQLTLTGLAAGEPVVHSFDVLLPELALREGFVPRVWGRRRVGDLLQQIKLGDADPGLVNEAIALARRYGVVTEFTYFAQDEAGDMHMTYSEVPVTAVGSAAVNTSASIDSYQKGGTIDGGASDAWIRYHLDRTYPIVGGWFTDTTLAQGGNWTELHFDSALYWQLLADEHQHGVAGALSVGANAKFEFLGRRFRVTDPLDSPIARMPTEAGYIPAAVAPPASSETRVTVTPEPAANGQPDPRATAEPLAHSTASSPVISGEAMGCSSTSQRPGPAPLLLFGLALGLLALRRHRDSA